MRSWGLVLGVGIGLGVAVARGQGAPMVSGGAAKEVTFQYTATIRTLPSYTFHLREDGSGSFVETVMGPDGTTQESRSAVAVSAKTAGEIFAGAQAIEKGGFACAGKMKGIADTGVKVLGFDGGSCTYNYSPDKTVAGLTDAFEAMALTLAEGRRLAFKHKYDRLGLNDEMTVLWDGVKAGRASELGNIRAVLQSLVEDGDVLERVRDRAATLLKMGNGG